MGNARAGAIQADLEHDIFEDESVLSALDGFGVGSDETGTVAFQCAVFNKGHGGVQGGLAAEGGKDGIGLFAFQNFFDGLWCDRFHVGALCELGIGHDCGGVRVHQNDLVSLLAKRFAGLDS